MLSHVLCRPSEPRFANLSQQKMSYLEKDYKHLSPRNPIEALRHWQPPYHSDLSCPICLQTATFPVETNCGHLFCGSCLITYWKHGSWLGAINCPLCRQKVILLYNASCENQQDKPSKQIVRDIRDYNKRFSGQPRPFADYLYDMPLLLNLALRGIFTLGGLVWIFFLRIVVCSFGTIMCLTSRFDVMREPLCGILAAVDDLVVVFLLLICMFNICQQMESEDINMASSTTQTMLSES
ncbi:E3 ubiquitin-protein ligase RNF170-like [Chelonoidis abingdonii]|uniref:E3 ubiquitin-protein ligase RNF170-like n=1 Tax=Chelonoidis abingdonii TaxID=106734 RepID=UPI0013F229CC|nr:E3 ubiquitin-protein ligase RNF170-like isoform X1 [Chelonoidis abingdonii]